MTETAETAVVEAAATAVAVPFLALCAKVVPREVLERRRAARARRPVPATDHFLSTLGRLLGVSFQTMSDPRFFGRETDFSDLHFVAFATAADGSGTDAPSSPADWRSASHPSERRTSSR